MSTEEMKFDGDVVVVTGAGRGLGREYALALARKGARVVVNDLDPDVAESVVAEIRELGGTACADSHSVADLESAGQIIQTALDNFGSISALVNNAGVISFASFPDVTQDQWATMKAVTLDGTFNMCQLVWPHFARQGYGRIVNVTSNAGFAGSPTLAHYGTAKLGVLGLTKNLAHEGADHGIRVNAIAPMAVTRMNAEAFFGNSEPKEDRWQQDIADGKVPMGPASAVAPAVVWLAHPSTTVNGEVYTVSSGKVARVATVLGEGYFNPDLTPEDIRDNLEAVRSLDNQVEPLETADELALIPPLFAR